MLATAVSIHVRVMRIIEIWVFCTCQIWIGATADLNLEKKFISDNFWLLFFNGLGLSFPTYPAFIPSCFSQLLELKKPGFSLPKFARAQGRQWEIIYTLGWRLFKQNLIFKLKWGNVDSRVNHLV